MSLNRRSIRTALIASVAILQVTVGCSSRQTRPMVGAEGLPEQRDVDVLNADDVTIPISSMERFISNRLPGIVIRGRSIVIRGGSSFSSSNEALVVVDGREMDTATFLSMNPADVKRIEVLRGPEAAIFGRRGANGVLVVSTRE